MSDERTFVDEALLLIGVILILHGDYIHVSIVLS